MTMLLTHAGHSENAARSGFERGSKTFLTCAIVIQGVGPKLRAPGVVANLLNKRIFPEAHDTPAPLLRAFRPTALQRHFT
ncbi:hypothetical protein DMP08_10600 [Paraeggerthella hongkongensis]|uniref:Uncharacterized protein n=1 Tax=Paraeggerthella hongkongensis TaxID=230658 RepID=A0A3N0AYP3_9ACTN|nr:hypothetical protein DMP08_10600 [Paraeggerthella hongkongensis]